MTSYEVIEILKKFKEFQFQLSSLMPFLEVLEAQYESIVGSYIGASSQTTPKDAIDSIRRRSLNLKGSITGAISISSIFIELNSLRLEWQNLRRTSVNIEILSVDLEQDSSVLTTAFEEFVSSGSLKSTIDTVIAADNLKRDIDYLTSLFQFLRTNLIRDIEINDAENSFILILDSIRNYKDLTIKLVAIENLYSELCSLFKISESEYPLKIRKIETGSAVIDLIGNAAVLGCVVWFIKEGVKYLYRTYTTEGKIASIPKQLEAADSILQFTNKLEENGLDVTANREEIQKVLFRVTESLNDLLADQPKIKINDEEISVGDELEQKFLKDSEQLLLGEGEDPNS